MAPILMVCPAEGRKLRTDRDAVELIGEALEAGAGMVVIPVERLDEDFLRLRTGVAGEFIQKFVTYGVRLAIIGDISVSLSESSALRDFVYEANRGRHVWFPANQDEFDRRLLTTGDI
jgi:hypothetical protein